MTDEFYRRYLDENLDRMLEDMKKKRIESNIRGPERKPGHGPEAISQAEDIRIEIIRADNYLSSMKKLRDCYSREICAGQPLFANDEGKQSVRPFTFRETIQILVNDYETKRHHDGTERSRSDRSRLFRTRIDTCTGIAYTEHSSKFKIIPVCKELIDAGTGIYYQISIRAYEHRKSKYGFADYNVPIIYDNIYPGDCIKLDSRKGKYNSDLAADEVLEHPGWRAAVGDLHLLRAYRDIVLFDGVNAPYIKSMPFYISSYGNSKDELRVLSAYSEVAGKTADGLTGTHGVSGSVKVIHCESFLLHKHPRGKRYCHNIP